MIRENLYTPDCIRTSTGQYVNVFKPKNETINIEDIAHALSHQCRFGGHLPQFYSVAEHSIRVAQLLAEKSLKLGPWATALSFQGLMHDTSEAYLLDIPSPIKAKLSNYKTIENRLMKIIAEKFQFDFPFHENVKEADTELLQLEWDEIMICKKQFKPLTPEKAKALFLKSFTLLYRG